MNSKRFLTLLALGSLSVLARGADYDQAVNDLIPRLADPVVESRYAAQMQLQDIASQSSKPGNAAEREALGKVLAARAADGAVPQPARVWIVRQLEYMGGAEAVEALTKVMGGEDAELSECARRALEKNSAPAASDSLRAALEKATEPRWKNGLINSLGQRGEAASVRLLAGQLQDPATGLAAAQALGRIANQPAVEALRLALEKSSDPAAQALLEAANRLLARGDAANALEIYQAVYGRNTSLPTRAAALSGLITANPSGAADLLSRVLTAGEKRAQQTAIAAALSSRDKALMQMMVAMLPKLGPSAKAQVIGAVDAPIAEPAVIQAVSDNDEGVRRAALEALGRIGGAPSVPVLIQAVLDEGKPGKSTAETALARLSGEPALAALQQAGAAGEAKGRVAAINALAARRDPASMSALLKYSAETDSAVRKAAYGGLRAMAGDAEIEPLARQVLAGKAEAASALEAAAQHAQDKPAAVATLVRLAGNNEQKLAALTEPLSVLGGDEALGVLTKLVSSSNADTQNEAVRALGNWADFAAAKPLLAIAANKDAKLNQYVLAMQGIVRLVKSVETASADQRVELALSALEAARRPEEKKLALSALASVPHRKAAAAIKPLLGDPQLKDEACLAGVTLAEALVRSDKPTAKDLATAIKGATENKDLLRRADRVLSR
jgi:HEAT repeat protein